MTNVQRLLELALKGLEAERAKIDEEIIQIKSQINGSAISNVPNIRSPSTPARTKRRKMSAEARRRISAGMKRRYAELRKAAKPEQAKPSQGGLTAAGRKKLSEMMKARWAAKRKAAKKAA